MTSSSGVLTSAPTRGLLRYRIMAYATGFMLAFCCVVAWPLEHLAGLTYMGLPWIAHGWFFIIYVITAVDLGLRRRWSFVKLGVVIIAGTVPFAVFFVEHRINREEARPVRAGSRRARWAALAAFVLSLTLAACSSSTKKAGDDMSGMDMSHGMTTGLGNPSGDGKYAGFGLTPPQPRPNFVLTDEAGASYSFGQRTQGRPTLLFFGYTHCPDDCPTTMADIHLALKEVPAAVRAKTLVVFVTTDPARDNGAAIKKWLSQYTPGTPAANWIGLRGTRAQINAAQAAAHVTIAEDSGQTHSLAVLLYGPDDYAHVSFALTDTERQQMVHDLPIVAAGWVTPSVIEEALNVNRTAAERWAGLVVRLILAAVWLFAALSKLGDPRAFLRAVRAYQATPEWLSEAIAYGLPVLELCLAAVLFFGVAARVAGIVSSSLLVVFLVGIIQAWGRGLKLECGCFGGGGVTTHPNYWLDIVRDVVLLALSLFLVYRPLSQYSVDDYLTYRHEVAPPSAKAVRRDPKAIQRFQAKRAARERENRSRLRWVAASTFAVIVLICLIGVSVQSSRAKIAGTLTATNASVANGVVVGKATAPVTLDTYEDFQCPVCQNFESTTGADLTKLVTAGKIKIRYHMMAFLDSSSSGNKYSTRAANAALCASDVSTAAFAAYHTVLYGKDSTGAKVQPDEGSDGRTDGQLEAYFKQALPKATSTQTSTFATCVTDQDHVALVEAVTDAASKKNVNGTPTIFVDGKKVTASRTDVLAAITKASAG